MYTAVLEALTLELLANLAVELVEARAVLVAQIAEIEYRSSLNGSRAPDYRDVLLKLQGELREINELLEENG